MFNLECSHGAATRWETFNTVQISDVRHHWLHQTRVGISDTNTKQILWTKARNNKLETLVAWTSTDKLKSRQKWITFQQPLASPIATLPLSTVIMDSFVEVCLPPPVILSSLDRSCKTSTYSSLFVIKSQMFSEFCGVATAPHSPHTHHTDTNLPEYGKIPPHKTVGHHRQHSVAPYAFVDL